MIKKKNWDFPLKKHESKAQERQTIVEKSLKDIRTERDMDKTYKK